MKTNHLKSLLALSSAALILSACGGTSSGEPSEESSPLTTSEEPVSLITTSEAPDMTSETIHSDPGVSSQEEISSEPGEDDESLPRILTIGYHNDNDNQNNLAIYIWADGLGGILYTEWDKTDENFAYKVIELDASPFAGYAVDCLYFIIRPKTVWTGQSQDTKVSFDEFEWTEDGTNRLLTIYSCDGPGGTIELYDVQKDALGDKFTTFSISSDLSRMEYTASAAPLYINVYAYDASFYEIDELERERYRHDYLVKTIENPEANGSFTFEELGLGEFDPHVSYAITGSFYGNLSKVRLKFLDKQNAFDNATFIEKYTYGGHDLGLTYSKERTEWRLYAPTTAKAEILVYQSANPVAMNYSSSRDINDDYVFYTIPMVKQPGGLFTAAFTEKDLNGYAYLYRLYRDAGSSEAIDPYTVATGANSKRSAILDMSSTTPENFDESLAKLPEVKALNELSIYEVHVRDLTSHETWNGKEKKGTYKAFVEEGTTYQDVTTGFDHIKELHPDAVQILPFFDQDNEERTYDLRISATESKHISPAYNWGYNPYLYNCVEGSYASDPYDPGTRINEFKGLVQKLADNGMRVIMDVVYNHVSSVPSNPFTQVVPGYYFRYDDKGFLIDDTGIGNTVNTDRIMTRNFIVDSVCHYAKEYGIKGFRFDLMGAIDTKTMRAVKDALYDIDPSIVVYGEPWGYGTQHNSSPSERWGVYNLLGDNGKGSVGCFNDGGRNGLKGDTTWANVTPEHGFMSIGIDHMNADVKRRADASFVGWNANVGGMEWSDCDPRQTVNYVACHDNYTLFDQFNYCLRGDVKKADVHDDAIAADARKASVATLAATLISQGAGFLHGGDEFFRSKILKPDDEMFEKMEESYKYVTNPDNPDDSWWEGDGYPMDSGNFLVRNSYQYGDACNGFDYSYKASYNDLYLKVKEAMEVRKELVFDCLAKSKAQVNAGEATMWGSVANGDAPTDPIIAGYYKGKTNHYYVVLSGREAANGDYNNIVVGSCKIHIDYSSNGHSKGQEFNCETTLGAVPFEFFICHTI